MLDPQSLFNTHAELVASPELRGLPMLAGFTGFGDAGQALSQIRGELLSHLEHDLVAVFDADQLIDYRSRRPQISFVKDHLTGYEPPRLELHRMYDGLGEPFLLLSGFEPDLQWERFVAAVLLLVEQLDVRLVSWTHSIPMPVPHTRPVGVTVHGNRPDLIEGISTWQPTAELQASIGHLMELRLAEAGHDVVGYVMHVPHYLAEAEYPPAAVAALEHLGAASSLMLPTDRLREAGREIEQQIARQVEASAEVQGVVSTLEQRYDEYADGTERRSLLLKANEEPADAEEIGAAVEAYLASAKAEEETILLWPAAGEDGGDGSDDDGGDGGDRSAPAGPPAGG